MSINPCNPGVESKWQTRAGYGCLVGGQSPWVGRRPISWWVGDWVVIHVFMWIAEVKTI